MCRLVLLVAGLFAATVSLGFDDSIHRILTGAKASSAPKIDGDISDEVWKSAPLAEGFVDRQTGAPAPDATEARVLYDEQFIYVAFVCTETKPNEIAARETQEDSRWSGDNPLPFQFFCAASWHPASINATHTRNGNSIGYLWRDSAVESIDASLTLR